MPRPLLSNSDLRHRIDLYLSSIEVNQLRATAKAACLPLSTYIRQLVLGQSIEMPPTTFAVAQWRELGRLDNNLNQLTRLAHAGQLPAGLDSDLVEVSQLLRQLRMEVLTVAPSLRSNR